MSTVEYIKEQYGQLSKSGDALETTRKQAYNRFIEKGLPTIRHEEWKYTRIAALFNNALKLTSAKATVDFKKLPGHESANVLVFVNGIYQSSQSTIRSTALTVIALEEAAQHEYADVVKQHFGHSGQYLNDGINALNTAFTNGGIFISVGKSKIVEQPVYIYNIADAGKEAILAQPRSLVHLNVNAQLQIVEHFISLGQQPAFTNQVMEVVVETDAR
ncbi:MAG: Fe-S cluster assembly protein SufD, partial [Pedobacter sp.]